MARASSLLLLILVLVCAVLAYLYYDAFSANQQLEAKTNELQVLLYVFTLILQSTLILMHRNKYEAFVLIRKISPIN